MEEEDCAQAQLKSLVFYKFFQFTFDKKSLPRIHKNNNGRGVGLRYSNVL